MGKRGANRSQLVLVAGSSPKMRKASKRDWTKAKEQAFLTSLAESCNVTRSAAAAGVSVAGAYKRRRENAAFRAGWAEAIATAYRQLELVLLDRALNGTEKVVKRPDGSESVMREYSDRIALTLLKMHRDSAVEAELEPSEQEVEEVRERLFAKLQRLRRRIEAEEKGAR